MYYLTGKIVLELMLCMFMVRDGVSAGKIAAFLVIVSLSMINSAMDSRFAAIAEFVVFTAICICIPQALYFLPVVVSDYVQVGMRYMIAIELILVSKSMFLIGVWDICFILLTAFFAYLFTELYLNNKKLNLTYIKSRDDSEEKNRLLAEKNTSLIKEQDREIYVATLKERNRIAREIHDNVGHTLTRSILQMGALLTIYKDEPIHGQLEMVKESLDDAMNNIRSSVHDLHDESVDLKQSIEEIAGALEEGFRCKIDYDISPDLDRKYKYAIIGIVKEAVANIIKYSKNDRVEIKLDEHPAMIQLIIRDYSKNGKTNSKDKEEYYPASGGIGLRNMRDRVLALGGNISITKNEEFRVFVSFPK